MKSSVKKPFLTIITAGLFLLISPLQTFPAGKGESPPEKPIIHFGFIPIYTPQLMYEKFQPFLDYLSANGPYKFKMRLTKDYKGIIGLLQEGTIDIALLGGASYLVAKEKIELVPILKPLNHEGEPFYKSVIIAREDKAINNISDLKGKSFAFASRWSTSGAVVPIYHLYANGIGLQGLSSYFHLRYHDSVAREVLKGNYDAGAVIDNIFYSNKDRGLKIIFVSEHIPELTIVVRKGTPGAVIDHLKKTLLNLNPDDTVHREILKEWGEDIRYGFAEAKDSDFNGIRQVMEYLKGKGVYLRDDED